jgi:hypothetical protein
MEYSLSKFEPRWNCGSDPNFPMCLASRLFSGICLADDTLEIQYLLHLWDIVCACQLDVIANLVDHQGQLLVQNGTLVDLQWGLQLG